MNEFRKLSKLQRVKVVESGALKRVTDATGKHQSVVSRTFAGKIGKPDPRVVEALRLEVEAVLFPESKTA